MSLKNVTQLAKRFQLKLGQSHLKGDPMDFEGAKQELGAITDVKEYAPPKAKPAPVNTVAPQVSKTVLPGEISSDLRAKLDVGCPGLQGMLHLTQTGNRVKVDYNADLWQHGAGSIKRLLTNALSPFYIVDDPIGHSNPSWTFNY